MPDILQSVYGIIKILKYKHILIQTSFLHCNIIPKTTHAQDNYCESLKWFYDEYNKEWNIVFLSRPFIQRWGRLYVKVKGKSVF